MYALFSSVRLLVVLLLCGLISPTLPATAHDAAASNMPSSAPPALVCTGNCLVTVVVELAEPSVVDALGSPSTRNSIDLSHTARRTRAHVAQLDQIQQRFLALLAPLHARVLYRMQRLANSVAIRIPVAHLADVRALPGVKAIHPLIPKYRSETQTAPFVGVPGVWRGADVPITGQGITIAIIDSGIDYTHAAFGGAGVPAAYASNDSAIIEPGSFPTAKVIGGYDFVGDAYVAGSDDPAEAAQVDPDPLDCAANGHGTAVANIAASVGVANDGTPYSGPYDATTPFSALRIEPGIAPEATLYALRVFGCTTQGTDYVDPALERAVDPNGDGDLSDHADVINMSLSSYFNDLDSTTAVVNAVSQLGIVVVASAGNSGDTTASIGAPAAADGALAVAASTVPADTIASYSSRGPRQPDAVLKPDIAAPGVDRVSAQAGTGYAAESFNGTSAAAPVLAGTMALLRQLHPTWTSAELKALVMNTATHDLYANAKASSPRVSPARAGAGRVDVAQAATASVIAFNRDYPERVSLSFGALAVSATTTLHQAITVLNKGTAPFSGSVTYEPITSIPGVTYTPDRDQVTLAPNAMTTITITLAIQPEQLQHTRDSAQDATQGRQSRHWLSEAAGYLTVTPVVTGTPHLRVPLYAAVRPASQMSATLPPFTPAAMMQTMLLTGTGFGPGLDSTSSTTASTSLASIYELQATSPLSTTTARPFADIAAVGIAQTPDRLVFGIGTHAPWFTPSPYSFEFRVLIDTDGGGVASDGTGAEYVLQTIDSGTRQEDSPTDVFEAVLTNQQTNVQTVQGLLNGLSPAMADTAIFNSTVLAMPVRIADLRLPAGQQQFVYRVQTYASSPVGFEYIVFDDSGALRYDVAAPHSGVATLHRDFPFVSNLPETVVPIRTTHAAPPRPLLILHHHNAPGTQIQVLPLPPSPGAYLPLMSR